jgi:hypothetical protein
MSNALWVCGGGGSPYLRLQLSHESWRYNRQVDLSKLGPTLVIASSLVLAIRTAKWNAQQSCATSSSPDWEQEMQRSVQIANRVLAHLIATKPGLFTQHDVPWYQPDEDESPK